jgi:hypothetical protein
MNWLRIGLFASLVVLWIVGNAWIHRFAKIGKYASLEQARQGADVYATGWTWFSQYGLINGIFIFIIAVLGIIIWRKTK